MKFMRLCLVGLGLLFGIVLSLAPPSLAAQLRARAQISGPEITGRLDLRQDGDSLVRVRVQLQGAPGVLTPGLHGVHIHETASCEPSGQTAFGGAKGHFDPGPFGSSTPVEANHPFHLGDLPNIEIDERGRGELETVTSRFALTAGPLSLFDRDDSAVIIHRQTDQLKAEGTAAEAGGARLACGLIERLPTPRPTPRLLQ